MPKEKDKFKELYGKLNPAQKQAVDFVEGPVMVVAGPGTGKTQVLTLRIANILRITDIEPENILALTFTESASVSMRKRLSDIVGSAAYSVNIETFHGFCNNIIQNYPESFPNIIGSQNITEVDQVSLIEEILEYLPLKILKPFGDKFYYLRSILSGINDLKREGVSEKEFEKIVKREKKAFKERKDLTHEKGPHKGKMKGEYQKLLKRIEKNLELSKVYAEYEKNLRGKKWYDFSDMIMEVFRVLSKDKNLLLMLQEEFQYILVDEHQDTNNAQNKILELLLGFHEHPNIFVVGDEKQAIFRFQGASLENFLYFKNLYPSAKLITLSENYRSTQSVLDSAHSLIAGEKKLKSQKKKQGKKIALYPFKDEEMERFFLADDISKKIKKGVPPDEIAILYRDNRDAIPVVRMFEKFGIPFVVQSDEDILEDPEIRKLVSIFRAVDRFGSDEEMISAMHVDFFGIHPIDVFLLMKTRDERKTTLSNIIRSEKNLSNLELESMEQISGFFKNLSKWKGISENADALLFFETVVRESGFLSHILNLSDAVEKVEKLNALFDELRSLIEVHRGTKISDFLLYLDTLSKHNLRIEKRAMHRRTSCVRLMTAHKSKGLEFGHVYIIGAFDGHWGNKRSPKLLPLPPSVFSLSGKDVSQNEIEDERRLFYVALTRAKEEVIISYGKTGESGKGRLPSLFVGEIKKEFIEEKNPESYEKAYGEKKEIPFMERTVSGVPIKNREFTKELFLKRGLSVTGLNNYLKCPWQYFYMNLLRIPKAKTKHQMYGTAVHAALRDFFEIRKKRDAGKDFLLKRFEFHLKREAFSENDFREAFQKGKESLGGYVDTYKDIWKTNVITEFAIKGVLLKDDIRLTGKLDKVEFLSEDTVNVVDYKTGKPKSRGVIDGGAPKSEGEIKRQLTFYAILLDLYKEGKYKMVSGEIDFVEPDEKGRYKKEFFEIETEEKKELKEIITDVSKQILSLSFWNSRCEDKKCEFCTLREMMGE